MKALSVCQPWASLIAIGAKRIETRSWPVPTYMIGQRIAIHASKGFKQEYKESCHDPMFFHALWPNLTACTRDEIERITNELPRGKALATAKLKGSWPTDNEELVFRLSAQELAFGFYDIGRWMWVLEDVQPLPKPIEAKGSLGFWNWEMPA